MRKEIDVAAWLEGQGLGAYADTFAEQAIDADTLAELTEQDLVQLGLPLGHRKRLLRAISELAPRPPHPPAPSAETPGRRAEAQRRQLTVMFVDLVGSTQLAAGLDPEDLREVVGAYQDCCTRAIERFEGHVAKFLGDGVLAYFGYPQAHEDDAERAIRAGLDLVDAIGRLGLAVPLAARVGISTGEVVAGDLVGERSAEQQAVVGETPNRAFRLQALAEPGSVVIGPHTRALVGRLFDYEALGAHAIKGFHEPIEVSRVLGPSAVADRFAALRSGELSPLVGREHEIALLLERWEQARQGEGHVVLLGGEPGIGKSRVVQALCERLENRAHALLRYQCLPYYRHSAFQPVIEEIERTAGIDRSDPAEARQGKLRAHLATLGPAGENLLAPLAELASIADRRARFGAQAVAASAQGAPARGAGAPDRGHGGAPAAADRGRGRALDRPVVDGVSGAADRPDRLAAGPRDRHDAAAGGSAAYRRHAAHGTHAVAAQPAAERRPGRADGVGQAPARSARQRDRDQDRGRAAVRRGADQGGAGLGSLGRSGRSLGPDRPARPAGDPGDLAGFADGAPRPAGRRSRT